MNYVFALALLLATSCGTTKPKSKPTDPTITTPPQATESLAPIVKSSEVKPQVVLNPSASATAVTVAGGDPANVDLGFATCPASNGLLSNCSIKQLGFAPKQVAMSVFSVTYTFYCGVIQNMLTLQSDLIKDVILVNTSNATPRTVTLVGYGPISLSSADAGETLQYNQISHNCKLDVKKVEIKPLVP